jgi:hypothetical protein
MTGASRARPGDRPYIPYVSRTNPIEIRGVETTPKSCLCPYSIFLSPAVYHRHPPLR